MHLHRGAVIGILAILAATSGLAISGHAQVSAAAASRAANAAPAVKPDTTTTVTTGGGTTNYIPEFTGASTIGDSIIYATGNSVGIGDVPNSSVKLDVNGAIIMRGEMIVSRTGNATASQGFPSYGFEFFSNVYNSSSKTGDNPYFQLQSEPTGNNTSTPSATFNLLFANNGGAIAETGFYINPNGTMHFAPAQTFPIAAGPPGPQGPTGATGPTGPQGATGPPGTIPANLTALSNLLGTSGYRGGSYINPVTCTLGDIVLSANSYGGGNMSPANGAILQISQNAALFALLGTTFGGDGSTTFALPDLRAVTPNGLQYSICVEGYFPSRAD